MKQRPARSGQRNPGGIIKRPNTFQATFLLALASSLAFLKFKCQIPDSSSEQTRLPPNQFVNSALQLPARLPKTPIIFFHSHQLSNRGTEVAIFDYAFWLEAFYEAKAHFLFPYPGWTPPAESALLKFRQSFPGRLHFVYEDHLNLAKYREAVDKEISYYNGSALYRIELMHPDYEVSKIVPTLVHEVFSCSPERMKGTKYMAISSFVKDHLGGGCTGSVPHIAWMPDCDGRDFRDELDIPEDAFVFAWYGGHDAWDPTVTQLVEKVALERGHRVSFLFQNLPPSDIVQLSTLGNVHIIQSSAGLWHKCKFVNSADAFLHTRRLGETFGLAVAEFSLLGKPIITSSTTPHRFHLELLGRYSHTYANYEELKNILMSLNQTNSGAGPHLRQLYSEYSPSKVMKRFNEQFFDGKLVPKGRVLKEFSKNNLQLVPPSADGHVLGIPLL